MENRGEGFGLEEDARPVCACAWLGQVNPTCLGRSFGACSEAPDRTDD